MLFDPPRPLQNETRLFYLGDIFLSQEPVIILLRTGNAFLWVISPFGCLTRRLGQWFSAWVKTAALYNVLTYHKF